MGMEYTVSGTSILCMTISMLVSFLFPVILLILIYKKRNGKPVGFLPPVLGIAGFILFALILEQIMHGVVMSIPAVKQLFDNSILVYGLYGGLAAGIFEETARLLAFLILKKRQSNLPSALAYGVGHGGIEAVLLGSMGMLSNIINAMLINSGALKIILSSLDETLQAQVAEQLSVLVTTEPSMFILGGIERVLGVILHIALSVLVWLAVTRFGHIWYYPLAILLHAAVDFGAVLYQRGIIKNEWIMEGIIFICVALISLLVFFIYRSWQKKNDKAQNVIPADASL